MRAFTTINIYDTHKILILDLQFSLGCQVSGKNGG